MSIRYYTYQNTLFLLITYSYDANIMCKFGFNKNQQMQYHSKKWQPHLAAWVIDTYDAIVAVLDDAEMIPLMGDTLPTQPIESSTQRWRKSVRQLYHQQMAWMQGQMTQSIEQSLTQLPQTPFDLYETLVLPWCQQLAFDLLGLPTANKEVVMEQAAAVFLMQEEGKIEAGTAATVALYHLFLAALEQRKQQPQKDIISAFVHTDLQESIAAAQLIQFLLGITTTLPLLLTNAMHYLWQHPRLAAPFCERPKEYVQEVLRMAGPTRYVFRVALADKKIGGQAYQRGDRLALDLYQANRDSQYFDIANKHFHHQAAHLSFGHGVHACLGSAIVRQATIIFATELLTRYPHLTYDEAPTIKYGGSRFIIGINQLFVKPRGKR